MKKALFSIALIMSLAACGTGDDNGESIEDDNGESIEDDNGESIEDDNGESITGLSLPQKITAISATQNDSNAPNTIQALSNTLLPTAVTDPGTDFSNDQTLSYVVEEGVIRISAVNYLLCFIDKLEYRSMVNKGAYKAAVNFVKCYEETYQTASIQVPNPIIEATVVSSRTSNQSPHIVKVWLPEYGAQEAAAQPGVIPSQTLIEISINQSPSVNNPFGDFSVNIADVVDASLYGGNPGEEKRTNYGRFQATLNGSGEPVFQDINTPDESVNSGLKYSAATILLDPSQANSGVIHAQDIDSINDTVNSTFFHYNANRVLKGEFNYTEQLFETQACLARDETRNTLYRYNLYHRDDAVFKGIEVTAGQRVQMNSSFSFSYNGLSGWMDEDYYWLENDNTLPDGAVITKQSFFEQGTMQQFTVYVSPGKLIRQKNVEHLLSTLQGIDIMYYGSHPDSNVYGNWIVRLTANNDFNITRERRLTGNAYVESDTYDHDNNPSTPEISVAATITMQDGERKSFYEKSNFQYYTYTHDSTVAEENRTINLEQRDTVTIGNTTLFAQGITEVTLYCYINCPKGGLNQESVDSITDAANLYYNVDFNATPVTYTAKLGGYHIILLDNTNGLPVDAKDLDLSALNRSSVYSDDLLPEPLPEPATYSQLLDAPLTYSWTTGSYSDYHQVVLVDENNSIFNFDKEMFIDYTYDASHDMYNTDPLTNPHHGTTFALTYSGPGNLMGLPYNIDDYGDYYAGVSLVAGTELGNDEGQYVVKAMLVFQYLLGKDISECSDLNVDTLLTDPRMALLTAADIPPVSFTAADKPVVNGGPAVKPDPL